jgi:hypothetical protein
MVNLHHLLWLGKTLKVECLSRRPPEATTSLHQYRKMMQSIRQVIQCLPNLPESQVWILRRSRKVTRGRIQLVVSSVVVALSLGRKIQMRSQTRNTHQLACPELLDIPTRPDNQWNLDDRYPLVLVRREVVVSMVPRLRFRRNPTEGFPYSLRHFL